MRAGMVRGYGLSKCLMTGLVALGVGGLLVSSASAAMLLDCRGGASLDANYWAVPVTGPGTATIDVWAVITGVNGNPNDDDVRNCIVSFLTTGESVKGNLTFAFLPDAAALGWNTELRAGGKQQDIDVDGDLDVGAMLVSPTTADYVGQASASPTAGVLHPAHYGTLEFTWTGWGTDAHGITLLKSIGKPGLGPTAGGTWYEDGVKKIGQPGTGQQVVLYRPAVAMMAGGGAPIIATPDIDVILDASASEGSINTYEWDLNGDGTPDLVGPTATLTLADLLGMGLEMGQTYNASLTTSYLLNPVVTSNTLGFSLTLVPEPATLALLGVGGILTLIRRRR